MTGSLGVAVGLGAVTGLRSFTGLAMVARELRDRNAGRWWRNRRAGRLERWLSEPAVAGAVQVLAVGELLGDKLPGVPDRTDPGPLGGRMVIGALLGALVAGEDRSVVGAAAGALGALAGAYAGWWLRREAGRATFLPDSAVALAEDAMAVAAARELARAV